MAGAAEILRQRLALPAETLPNRVAKAAMTEGLADALGRPTAGHARLYGAWARGSLGLLISGNVMVDPAHLERPGNVVLARAPDAAMLKGLKAWTGAARAQGAGFWMQVSHAGRQTPIGVNPTPKAPSAVPLPLPGKQFGVPVALEEAEIEAIIERYAAAGEYARAAGFTGVQIHAAHGYLISQFLSPRANKRSDAWGGPLENRARFLMEIVRRTRACVGTDFTLSVKLNSSDFQSGGFMFAESAEVAVWLGEAGVDVLELSGGTYERPRMVGVKKKRDSTIARESYFLEFARLMRARVSMPLMVTGGFRRAAAMAAAIADDGVALIGIGRPLCVDPIAAAKLFAGAASLERWEDKVRLGPAFMGPTSPFLLVRSANALASTYWCYQQLRLIAAGEPANPKLSAFDALRRERATQAEQLAAIQRAASSTMSETP
jgi:2,4-dienoyl-CoA reductase-like NADH-dependent reductase (Old Yellow Enzyme family)